MGEGEAGGGGNIGGGPAGGGAWSTPVRRATENLDGGAILGLPVVTDRPRPINQEVGHFSKGVNPEISERQMTPSRSIGRYRVGSS